MKLGKKISLFVAVFCLSLFSYSQVDAQESELTNLDIAQENAIENNGWVQSNGEWSYYQNNQKQVGWIQVSGVWYYTNASGVMQTGWLNQNGAWYYFNHNGSMVTGWLHLNGTYYYFNSSGFMVTGWLHLNGTYYYLNRNGAMLTGWVHLNGTYYYLNPSGSMITGWLQLNGTWYYLNRNGSMAKNTVIDGWQIAANGVATLIDNTKIFEEFQQEVLVLVNKERKDNGLKALRASKELANIATLKSEDMVNKNYFDHKSPTYGSAFDMMKANNINYRVAGENIAMGYVSPERVVQGWMNSPGHRKNILNSRFTELGVGIAKCNKGTTYWTQMFTGK